MIIPIFFSIFLPLVTSSSSWLPKCGTTQRQNLLNLISTDIFARHLNSGVLNSTLNECSNFHRHICPKGDLSASASTKGIFDQMVSIERSCTKYDLYGKFENHFNEADHFDNSLIYSNKNALTTILFFMPKSTLLTIYEYTTLHIQKATNFYSNVWDRRHWTSALDQAKFPAKYDPSIFINITKRKNFVDLLATNIKNITETCGGIQAMKNFYLPFLKDVTDYNHVVNIIFREGKPQTFMLCAETGVPRDRNHDSIVKVSEDYGRVLETAAWSSLDNNGKSRYDRFYDFLMDIYHNTLDSTLNNIGTQNSSSTLPKDFYNFYLEERAALSPLAILPHLRNFIAINRAHERIIATINLELSNRWYITSSLPNALSGFYAWILVRNQAIFDLISRNSPDSAVMGSIGYLYGHEMYHGVERELYPYIMPNSPVTLTSQSCIKSYFADVVQRFPGDPRFDWRAEEEADVYGTQIAYGAFKTAIGDRIDDLVYPSLNITHRQLFFYANSIFSCNTPPIINLPFVYLPDGNYEVNGRIAQVSEFQSTFQCSDSDNMVFPQTKHCPIFFPTFTD